MTTVKDQNAAWLAWAEKGGEMPPYVWPDAPNVPPKPPAPEELHRQNLAAVVMATVESIEGQDRTLKAMGRPQAPQEQFQKRRAEILEVLATSARYDNDITRHSGLAELAAINLKLKYYGS